MMVTGTVMYLTVLSLLVKMYFPLISIITSFKKNIKKSTKKRKQN